MNYFDKLMSFSVENKCEIEISYHPCKGYGLSACEVKNNKHRFHVYLRGESLPELYDKLIELRTEHTIFLNKHNLNIEEDE